MSKIVQNCFGFALIRYVIGPQNSRRFLNQPDSH